ncbi:LOB domain-containing protein 29-like [Hibiscus syriacus]|uniref:LOB domain-containing protein 29-like n=1 Tax=Hibiscus syriacus TaxID=106335 RepID=A0A6A2ZG01_HIBSY|nr:1-aminocyclopropane-1-carboxylate oxidase homolog 1-like [Hibiscus syriacus]KAE8689875.1 LOB domain-containing protein 29-like [Hibiscus syriacus]
MEATPRAENINSLAEEMKAFLESKEGVKGLVDSGITKIPSFFIRPADSMDATLAAPHLQIPEIDLKGFEGERRREIVDAIRDAAQTWGFFRMVNHCVPIPTMENMIDAIRQFHEQPQDVKKAWYSRNESGQRLTDCNTNIKAAAWRDTLALEFPDGEINEQAIPQVCRKATSEYMKHMVQLKDTLSELISEALGLRRHYLASIKCMKRALIQCHYHPPCPQPELTLGTSTHTDPSFLTILLENNIDRLQVLHQDQWVNVPHRHGYLIANIGDFLQIVSNDKFKSATHRVLAGSVGPRISAACCFAPMPALKDKPYGAAEELVTADNPPIYKRTSLHQYLSCYKLNGKDARLVLPHFKNSCHVE